MRGRNLAVNPTVASSHEGRHDACPPGGFANAFLTLPALSTSIPFNVVSTTTDEKWAKVALLCLELTPESDLEITAKTTPRDIVTQALSKWASKHCADIALMGGFEVQVMLDSESLHMDCDDAQIDWQKNWVVGLCSTQTERYFNVKQKLEALEVSHPGLAHTVVSYAERASYRTVTMFSPQVAFAHAENLYWQGTDNDKDFLEEMKENGMEDEEEDVFLPSQFISSFPEWFFKGECLSRDALQVISQEQTDAGSLSSAVLSIMDMVEQDVRFPHFNLSTYTEQAYFSCYLGGDETDQLGRVLDDYYNYANECSDSFTDMFGLTSVPLAKRPFLKWAAKMEKGFALYTQLDRLMQHIGGF